MLVNRSVKVIASSLDDSELAGKTHYQDFINTPNLVLLGEPGSGKSYTFTDFAEQENAELYQARTFPNDADEDIKDSCIYIDGLDESRSTSDNSNSIEKIVARIKKFPPLKVRISCRAQDWLGETDLQHFERRFKKSGGYAVIQLCELSTDEQKDMLSSLGEKSPTDFIDSAHEHSVDSFLSSPQTLKMLHEVVTQNRSWPTTKSDLFDQATTLLLTEHNRTRSHIYSHESSIEVLRDAAGALYAVFLISGIHGFSLNRAVADEYYPSYLDVTLLEENLAQEVLKTKAFNKVTSERVSSTHRTIAEYLAAKWIAFRINSGLPLNRVLSLIGFESKASIELRGLYAWLPEFLQNQASSLIRNDPVTMISGGDVSSLSSETLCLLINEISDQSKENPWYLDWHSGAGKFSRQDLVPTFIDVLSDDKNSIQVHSFILESIANGPQLNSKDLGDLLFEIIFNQNAVYTLRSSAAKAVINIFPQRVTELRERVRVEFLEPGKDCRLTASIIGKTYSICEGPRDVAVLFQNYRYGLGTERNMVHEIYEIISGIEPRYSEAILNAIIYLEEDKEKDKRGVHREYEASEIMDNFLSSYLESDAVSVSFLWDISEFINTHLHDYGYNNYEKSKTKFRNHYQLLERLVIEALDRFDHQEDRNLTYIVLRSFISFWDSDDILKTIKYILINRELELHLRAETLSTAFLCFWRTENPDIDGLLELKKIAKGKPVLMEIFEKFKSCPVDEQEQRFKLAEHKRKLKLERSRIRIKNEFDENIEEIKSGESSGWLSYLANVYYCRFSDTSKSVFRSSRLDDELGERRGSIARQALIDFSRSQKAYLSFEEHVKNTKSSWGFKLGYAVLAGIDLDYETHRNISLWPDSMIEMAIKLSFDFPIVEINEVGTRTQRKPLSWLQNIYSERKEASINSLLDLARINISTNRGEDQIDILATNEAFHAIRYSALRAILEENSEIHVEEQSLIIKILLQSSENDDFLKQLVTFENIDKNLRSFIRFFLTESNNIDSECCWVIIDLINNNFYSRERIKLQELTTDKIVVLISVLAESQTFSDDFDVRSNDKDSDASHFIIQCLNELSNRTSKEDINQLKKLIAASTSESYQSRVRHSIHKQDLLRREHSYIKPGFKQTLNTLKGGEPANHQDFISLTIDHLETLERNFRTDNTNGFKSFWNEEQHRVTSPKPEDAARDVLISNLRACVQSLAIQVEPEGLMANDKRADIILSSNRIKIPVEIKRDYHKDVWSACENQLESLYSIHPQADGYGIFLVIWYGNERRAENKIPLPPKVISNKRPESATEMQAMLESMIDVDKQHRIRVKVFDASPLKK